MADQLSFAAMPAVLDDGEVPFVIGLSADPRPSVEFGGADYRRGNEMYTISWAVGGVWLRARVEPIGPSAVAVASSAGPMLTDWWPMLAAAPEDPGRPYLSAGASKRTVDVPLPLPDGMRLPVRIVPSSAEFTHTLALWAVGGQLADEETVPVLHVASLCVIRAALQVFLEYGDLVGDPPDVLVRGEFDTDGITLADALVLASELAGLLDANLLGTERG